MRKRIRRAGWTGYTYALSAFLFIMLVTATTVAVSGNPTSQLSNCCYAAWAVLVAATSVALFDRRK